LSFIYGEALDRLRVRLNFEHVSCNNDVQSQTTLQVQYSAFIIVIVIIVV